MKLIAKCAKRLFDAYPGSDYEFPRASATNYVEVLEGYSDAIIEHVTSNRTGIQRREPRPPRLSELVKACDEAAAILERAKRYANWGHKVQIEPPKGPRPTEAQMKAKYGENYGLDPTNRPATEPLPNPKTDRPGPTWDEVTKTYAADPSRIAALTAAFMTRKSTLA